MKNRNEIFVALAILILLVTAYACKKDTNDDPTILGSWVMNIGEEKNIPVQLSFFANDFFEWIPLVPTDTHTRSAANYTFADGVLTIMNDPDCPENGEYKLSLQGSQLEITLISDDCEPRVSGLQGTWNRKNDLPERRIEGIWYRNLRLEGKDVEVVFHTQQNGVFEWIMSESTDSYQTTNGRFAVSDDYLVIYNFLDCFGLGYYTYTFTSENRLLITEHNEPCEIRPVVLTGTWLMD